MGHFIIKLFWYTFKYSLSVFDPTCSSPAEGMFRQVGTRSRRFGLLFSCYAAEFEPHCIQHRSQMLQTELWGSSMHSIPIMTETIFPPFTTWRSLGKNSIPESATGSLLSAPTMLYVVEEATRTLHAVL